MEPTKKQKVRHLTPLEWVRQRPEVFFGPMELAELAVARVWKGDTIRPRLCPALVTLCNELVTNALDNAQRDATQTYIAVGYDDGVITVRNDGSVIPLEKTPEGEWMATLAFSKFQTGSNFDDAETGKKDTAYTAGRNGVGSKGCNAFARTFSVTIVSSGTQFSQVWHDGMKLTDPPKIVKSSRKTNLTSVAWTPDYAALGHQSPPDAMEDVVRALAHNAALCASDLRVSFNDETIKIKTPEHVCKSMGGVAPFASDTVLLDGRQVMRVCCAARADEMSELPPHLTVGFVNSTPCAEGSHARYILGKIADVVTAKAQKKQGSATPAFVSRNAVVVATLLVQRERFTDQRKTCLDAPLKDWGWKWDVGASFVSAVERSALVERAIRAAKEKEDKDATRLSKVTRHPAHIPKYDPALKLHTGRAVLLVTEGDSAKNFATAGISVVGRRDFGVYPIRGKFFNVRGERSKAILENKEASELLKILGIQLNHEYDAASARALPYAKLMVMADQDVDGSHIAGLLYNLIDVCAGSLLRVKPDFLSRFATSLIRVKVDKTEVGFYSQVEYEAWHAERVREGKPTGEAKYFKGLGTSTAQLAKSYFADLRRNTIDFVHTGSECAEALDLAFNKKRADDRKAFLLETSPTSHVDYQKDASTVDDFVRSELLPQYAMASLTRAIPGLDGFKEALRKVFFGARDLKLTSEISVANAAGKIASRTMYHHRGTAMEDAIIGMAADYAGTANINLLDPMGQFGTRHNHTAASAAYPKIRLAKIHSLVFPPADDPVLSRVVDEGETVEPVRYAPVIAMPLITGCKGIATGWSTDVPAFHPLDVARGALAFVDEEPSGVEWVPWYRGFHGEVRRESSTVWVARGVATWVGDDVHVTEVPPFWEVDSLRATWAKNELAPGGVVAGDRCTDVDVHLVLKQCVIPRDVDLVTRLGLEKKLTFNNVHLLDDEGKLHKYETPDEVVEAHARARLQVYEKRRDHNIRVAQVKERTTREQSLFVRAVVDEDIDLRACETEEAFRKAFEEACELTPTNPSALLDMPARAFNEKRAVAYADAHQAAFAALVEAQNVTARELWRRDLKALDTALRADARYARAA